MIPILQVTIGVPGAGPQFNYFASEEFLSIVFTFVYIIIAILACIITIRLIQKILRKMNRIKIALERTTFLISIPRDIAEEDKGKTTQDMIGVCETIYTNLGGLSWRRTSNAFLNWWYKFWFGPTMHMSFEVVLVDGLIRFYVNTPAVLAEYVEKQIHSQYPDANIEIVDDYNLFLPSSQIWGASLKTAKQAMYPMRSYKKLETDPLVPVLSVMSKMDEGETAAMQLIIRPADNKWQKKAMSFVSTLQRGKRQDVIGKAAGSGSIIGGIRETASIASEMVVGEKQAAAPDIPTLTPLEQELLKSIEEKAGRTGFFTNIRLITTSSNRERSRQHLERLVNAFSQYQALESDQKLRRLANLKPKSLIKDFIFRHFREKNTSIFSPEELCSLWHLPLPQSDIPNIYWMLAKKSPAPVNMPHEGIRLGVNEYRGIETIVRIKREDRRRHMYIVGRSGSGKSTIMTNMAVQDIQAGEGVCVIDPHGDLIEDILPHIPKERAEDVVIFNPSDLDRPMGLNMLEFKTQEQKDFVTQEMISIFYKLFGQEMIGPMFEHYMRNAILALLDDEESGATIVEIPRMFTDDAYRKKKVAKVQNAIVKNFWEQEFEQSQKGSQAADMLSYVISKIGRFLTNDMMRNIIGQTKSGFDFRDVMDNQKILLVNLSKGVTGEVNSGLLGMIIVTKLQVAAMGRATMPKEERKDFYLYIDEFQNFVTDSIATILSEARKYLLNLIIAHQYVGQLAEGGDTAIRDAVFGNVGSMVVYRIGVDDADTFAKEFSPTFNEFDVLNIPQYTGYVKLLIDNTGSKPFNMKGDPPPPGGDKTLAENIKQLSRYKFARDKRIVEMEISERSQLGKRPAGPSTSTGRGSGK